MKGLRTSYKNAIPSMALGSGTINSGYWCFYFSAGTAEAKVNREGEAR